MSISRHFQTALVMGLIFALAPAAGPTMPSKIAIRPRQSEDQFTPVRTLIKTLIDERRVPSISVAVAKEGNIVWEEAFGFADKEKGINATPETMYSLASISKPITATALMILKEMEAREYMVS